MRLVLGQAHAEETTSAITPTSAPSPTPFTPQTPRPSPTPAVNGLEPLVIYRIDLLNPNSSVYYTDLMPLSFTVEWRKNITYVSWITPNFSYKIDNGSRVTIHGDFVQGEPYIDWANETVEKTAIATTIDVSNLTAGTHTLTLYSDTLVAAGQLGDVDCILGTAEFHTGEPPTIWISVVEANVLPLFASLVITLTVLFTAFYLKKKQKERKISSGSSPSA